MSKKKKHKKKFRAQLHQALQEIERQHPAVATSAEKHSSLPGKVEEQKNVNTESQNLTEPQKDSVSSENSVLSVSQKRQENKNEPEKLSEVAPPQVDEGIKSDEYAYVKKDVTKIVLIVAICIVILVGIWILSLKTDYISNLANQLATFSHLSQGE